MTTKPIYCISCEKTVNARLTDGKEIYSHRPDLYNLPFWRCDHCGNYVGCHHKTANRTQPLGAIPSEEVRKLRNQIHAVLAPLWQSQAYTRKKIYSKLKDVVGREYHTADLQSISECEKVLTHLNELTKKATLCKRM